MNEIYLSSWEERQNDTSVSALRSLTNAQSFNTCNALRARIETTLLADLPEEERSSVAEHLQSCSACAGHFQGYQMIEEFAGQLPYYSLREERTQKKRPRRRRHAHPLRSEGGQVTSMLIVVRVCSAFLAISLLHTFVSIVRRSIRKSFATSNCLQSAHEEQENHDQRKETVQHGASR